MADIYVFIPNLLLSSDTDTDCDELFSHSFRVSTHSSEEESLTSPPPIWRGEGFFLEVMWGMFLIHLAYCWEFFTQPRLNCLWLTCHTLLYISFTTSAMEGCQIPLYIKLFDLNTWYNRHLAVVFIIWNCMQSLYNNYIIPHKNFILIYI